MLRVNRVKFQQKLVSDYINHKHYDALELFILFLVKQKIWTEFFAEMNHYQKRNMNELFDFFERKTPDTWITSAFIFSSSQKDYAGINYWNFISDSWVKELENHGIK